jgi:methylenetetrahydrofolate reductase (NADPH)
VRRGVRIADAAVVDAGLTPVPHLSARRLRSTDELDEFLDALGEVGATRAVFAVGGDPAEPMGPFSDSLELIESGALQRRGVEQVAVAGYPEGHPDIPDAELWCALDGRHRAVADAGLELSLITQFGFDPAAVLSWLEQVRARGIDQRVRIGVPGPAGVKRLLAFAGRFGIASSGRIVKKYGFSLTNLMSTAGPERFLDRLAGGLDPAVHGDVALHFSAFGGLEATSEWITRYSSHPGTS